jgi:DNA-binding LacI/PurR family transcriptional regulator
MTLDRVKSSGNWMRDHRRATIYGGARAAGVSHQTISNVLHKRGRVGTNTRARAIAAIAELDYRPHTGADKSAHAAKRTTRASDRGR